LYFGLLGRIYYEPHEPSIDLLTTPLSTVLKFYDDNINRLINLKAMDANIYSKRNDRTRNHLIRLKAIVDGVMTNPKISIPDEFKHILAKANIISNDKAILKFNTLLHPKKHTGNNVVTNSSNTDLNQLSLF